MARRFVSASSQSLQNSVAVIATAPMTLSCWFYSSASSGNLLSVRSAGHSFNYYTLRLASSKVQAAMSDDFSAVTSAATDANYSTSNWQHAAGVWTSTSAWTVLLGGSHKGTATGSVVPANIDSVSVAELRGNYVDALIAEAAIWNVALGDAEVLQLAQGLLPPFVRPQSLVAYWPLREPGTVLEIDWTPWSPRRYDLTVTGATPADHPTFLQKYTFGLSKKNIIGVGVSSPIVRPVRLGSNRFVTTIGQTNGILGPFGSRQ